jgi:ATP-dependent Zn protease
VLTTNRVEVLERALAERPGRVDEAVEISAPDAAGRERLLRLYGAGTGLTELDLTATVEQTEGLTATYIRELARRAAIAAALARPNETPVRVRQEDLDAAAAHLQSSRARLTRALLGQDRGITTPPGPYVEHGFHGFHGLPSFRHGPVTPAVAYFDDGEDGAPPVPPGWESED